jgi:hypothetical protein
MTQRMIAVMLFAFVASVYAQRWSPKWEELTAADFVQALGAAKGSCVLNYQGDSSRATTARGAATTKPLPHGSRTPFAP